MMHQASLMEGKESSEEFPVLLSTHQIYSQIFTFHPKMIMKDPIQPHLLVTWTHHQEQITSIYIYIYIIYSGYKQHMQISSLPYQDNRHPIQSRNRKTR